MRAKFTVQALLLFAVISIVSGKLAETKDDPIELRDHARKLKRTGTSEEDENAVRELQRRKRQNNKLPSTIGFQTAAAQGSSANQYTRQRNRGSSLFEDYHDDDDIVPAGSRSAYFAYTSGRGRARGRAGGNAPFSAQQVRSRQRNRGSSLFEDYHDDDDIVPAGSRSTYFAYTSGRGRGRGRGSAPFNAQQGTSYRFSALGSSASRRYGSQRSNRGSSLFEDYHNDDDIVPAGGRSNFLASIGEGFSSHRKRRGRGGTRGYRALGSGA